MIYNFARPVPQLSEMFNQMTNLICRNWNQLPSNLNHFSQCLQGFCNTIHQKGAALSNCWGFVDGTVRSISKPNESQKICIMCIKSSNLLLLQTF